MAGENAEQHGSSSPLYEQYKKEGNEFFAAGEYAKAVAAYNKAVKADPENAVLYSNRAAAFLHLEKEVKAIKDAEQAIALKPDWAKGYYRKGAALAALRRWDEAIEILKKALELEPKSKEIAALLRETTRKRSTENCEKKREESKGLKLVASDKHMPGEGAGKSSVPSGDGGGSKGAALGFSEAVVENFVRDSLNSAITQFVSKGEIKSIVYVQPSTQGEPVNMIGIEAGFDSVQANEQCCTFLRTFCADHKALAVLIITEKKNIAYPQVWKEKPSSKWKWKENEQGIFMQMYKVWKEKPSSKWKWKENEQGIFMQLDAYSVGGVSCTTERKVWFIPTTPAATGNGAAKPEEPVELEEGLFAIMPPLLRSSAA